MYSKHIFTLFLISIFFGDIVLSTLLFLFENLIYLFDSMVDKDAKEREMRRENLLLTSKIQLLENQMGNFHDRIDLTVREQSQLRRDVNSVRLDINVSSEVNN
jgi:hypothetical protein